MENKEFKLDLSKMHNMKEYLLNNSKDKSSAFLGASPSLEEFYFLHKGYGVRIRYDTFNIIIHGKTERAIDEEFSRLEKVSEGY